MTTRDDIENEATKWAIDHGCIVMLGRRESREYFWLTYDEYRNNGCSDREIYGETGPEAIIYYEDY